MRRVRLSSMVAVLATVAVLSGFPPLAGATSKASVKSLLLAVSDLPAGWTVNKATGTGTVLAKNKCLAGLSKAIKDESTGTAVFAENSLAPILLELLATGHGSVATYRKGVADLASCHTLKLSAEGKNLSGTVAPMSFPVIGTSSVAYSLALTLTSIPVGADLVLFRTGKYIGVVGYADLATPSVTTVEAFTKEAVAKAEGMAVSPPSLATGSTTTTAG